MSRFLLLLGPSGVGKSSIIRVLRQRSSKFIYISPFMTRPLRAGESDKIAVSSDEMDRLECAGELLAVNTLFGGIRYGTPRMPIVQALHEGDYPVLDWPIDRLEIMRDAFAGRLFTVYVSPPSLEVLYKRISSDGRDTDGSRFASARREFEHFCAGEFAQEIDLAVVSEDGNIPAIAEQIYTCYTSSF